MWWFLAELEGLENSWAGQTTLSVDLLTADDVARYVASVYFATTLLTTTGFGDIAPYTPAEQVVAVLYMAGSLFYFGYIVNVVGTLLGMVSAKARSAAAVRAKLEDVEMWMSERRIPQELQDRVRRYFFEVWAPHRGAVADDAGYFQELPVSLRGEIVARLAGDTIRDSRMLRTLSPEVRAHLASVAVPRRLVAGHDLYEEGDDADRFWVLQDGELAVIRGIQETGRVVAPAIVGQAAVFSEWVEDCKERLHTGR